MSYKKIIFLILLTILLFLFWELLFINLIPYKIIKNYDLLIIYGRIFFSLMFCGLFIFGKYIKALPLIRVIFLSMFFGHLLAVFSFVIAQLFLSNAWERVFNSFKIAGFFKFVALEFIYPLVCLGWLFSLLAAVLAKLVEQRE